MSRPRKNTKKAKARKRKPVSPKAITELPDDEAIRKLFPKKVIDKIDREIDHARRSK